MIGTYFDQMESVLADFRIVESYSLNRKKYSSRQGYIKGVIVFNDKSVLEFTEVKDTELEDKIKYRYQYMNENREMIFRYDNAFHHRHIPTFPHHKHFGNEVIRSMEPGLNDILSEIKEIFENTECR